MIKNYTLDSFALLRHFQEEPGWEKVENILLKARNSPHPLLLNWINLTEFYYHFIRRKGKEPADRSLQLIREMPIELIPAGETLSLKAGEIKAQYPISLADSYCAATAILTQTSVLTGDKDFQLVSHLVEIEWI